jgi:hypothetical protein
VQPNNDEIPQDVQLLADEINRYLHEREFVADTLEGISKWWILRQRLQEEQRRVEQAMEYLCAKGVVETRVLPDGVVLYSPVGTKTSTQKELGDK